MKSAREIYLDDLIYFVEKYKKTNKTAYLDMIEETVQIIKIHDGLLYRSTLENYLESD